MAVEMNPFKANLNLDVQGDSEHLKEGGDRQHTTFNAKQDQTHPNLRQCEL